MNVEEIAKVCHDVNKAFCESIGDNSQPTWELAPEWQKTSCKNGVKYHLFNDTTPKDSHKKWMEEKVNDGWVYGPIKDVDKKEHPCIVPYEELPIMQQSKDYIFRAICVGLSIYHTS